MRSRDSDTSAIVLGLLLIAGVLLAHTCAACAQDAELPDISGRCAPELEENRRARLDYEGASGLWFHGDVARCMGGRLEALPLYAERVRLLEQRLELTDARDALQQRRVALAAQEAETAVEALEAAVRARRRAEEALDAWYRHPAFWFAVGVIITIALELAAVFAFQAVVP